MKNNKWFELTVRDSVTGEVLDVDQATYFRALYDTYARPYQRKTNIDPAGTKPGTKPFKFLTKKWRNPLVILDDQ